jgi:hypothetical protein
MIKEPKNVSLSAMLKQENVQPHVEIDGGDILNFTYNYFPTHPLK